MDLLNSQNSNQQTVPKNMALMDVVEVQQMMHSNMCMTMAQQKKQNTLMWAPKSNARMTEENSGSKDIPMSLLMTAQH